MCTAVWTGSYWTKRRCVGSAVMMTNVYRGADPLTRPRSNRLRPHSDVWYIALRQTSTINQSARKAMQHRPCLMRRNCSVHTSQIKRRGSRRRCTPPGRSLPAARPAGCAPRPAPGPARLAAAAEAAARLLLVLAADGAGDRRYPPRHGGGGGNGRRKGVPRVLLQACSGTTLPRWPRISAAVVKIHHRLGGCWGSGVRAAVFQRLFVVADKPANNLKRTSLLKHMERVKM